MPSGGNQESSSQSSQSVWQPQSNQLSALYGHMPGLQQDLFGQMPKLQEDMGWWNQKVKDQTAMGFQNQMAGGNLAGYDIARNLSNSLNTSMGNPTNEQQALQNAQGANNYSDQYSQTFKDDARGAMDMNLQAMDARAAASGMSGGSRHGTAIAQGAQDINSNLQSNLANVGYQDFTNRVNREQQAGANADMARLQNQNMLAGLTQQQNQNQSQALNQAGGVQQIGNGMMNTAMAPTNAYAQLMQAMGAPTVLSESTSEGSGMNFGL